MSPEQIAAVGQEINRAYHLHTTGNEAGAIDNPLPGWLVDALDKALKNIPVDTSAKAYTAVRYIGHRPVYKEGAYGTGIVFLKGESKLVPADKAKFLLTHKDVYEPGEVAAGTPAPAVVEKKPDESEDPAQMARDAIAAMNSRAAVAQFIKTNFNQDVDAAKSKLVDIKTQAVRLIDQYGIAA